MRYRHEEKFICSETDLRCLEIRLRPLMMPDAHTDTDGQYLVRSVYFDDGELSFWRENEMGISPRRKWRIRIYNCDPDTGRLECKYKVDQLTAKWSAVCPPGMIERMMNRNDLCMETDTDTAGRPPDAEEDVLQTFAAVRAARSLHPSVIVQYERTPFVYPCGNVRVTFDRNIAASSDFGDFFSEEIRRRPILPAGMHILEVKYDDYLPCAIRDAVQMRDMRRTTFSKYALCRKAYML